MHRSKEVTFKDVLILFLKKFERIFAFALCFAVVFAALGAWKSYRSVSGENLRKMMDDYQLKMDEYNDSTEEIRKSIEQDKARLENISAYTQNSIYYNMDPYHTVTSELVFYVDTGYQIAPSQYYQNPNKTGEIVSAYCDAYRSAELYDGIKEMLGGEIDVKYIDELLTIERAGDIQIKDSVGNVTVKHSDGNEGVVVIRAKAQDEQTASAITDFVFGYLKENFGKTIAQHQTTILSDSAMTVVDNDLEQMQKEVREEVTELEETIKTNEAQLATLERDMPQQPSVSMGSVLKKAVLFAILGGILGGVLICLWILLAYLADNRLDDAYQAQRLYNLELFGVAKQGSKKYRPVFTRLINNMEHNPERQEFESVAQAAQYTDSALSALSNGDNRTVAVVSTRENEAVMQAFVQFEQLSDSSLTYCICPDMLKNPQSVQKAAQADAVIVLEQIGVSLISEIDRQILHIEKSGKEILGMFLIDSYDAHHTVKTKKGMEQ